MRLLQGSWCPGDRAAPAEPQEDGQEPGEEPAAALVCSLQGLGLARGSRRRRSGPSRGALVLLLAGGLLNVLVGALSLAWPPLGALLQERLRMRPGLPPFEWWLQPPDILLRVYPFNVTNGERFLAGAEPRLRLQQVGPIVFRERLRHDGIAFNANGTLTYTAHRSVHPAPELSALRPEDPLLVPNLAVLGMASYLHDSAFFTKFGLGVLLRRLRSQPLVRMTVDHFLWNNSDPLLRVARTLAPPLVPVTNMGVLERIYAQYSDQATVYMGPDNGRRYFTINQYRGSPRFGYWPQQRCDAVEGATEGVVYPQGVLRNDSLRYFRKTLCRVAPVEYVVLAEFEKHRLRCAGDEVRDGIDVFRFELPDSLFDRNQDSGRDCFAGAPSEPLPTGLSDVSPCYYNFPMAASFPHFLNGDPVLVDSLEGLQPDRDKHVSYVIVEPITGIPLESCARMQSNIVVRKLTGFPKSVERFSNLTIPMFWAEYHQDGVPWYVFSLVYFVVNILPDLQSWFSFLMVITGSAMMASSAFMLLCHNRELRQHSYKFLDLTPSTASSSSACS